MKPDANDVDSWDQLAKVFDSFPPPKVVFDGEGGITQTTWIFRGHKSIEYDLEPRVERENKGKDWEWAALESMLVTEFQSKARMYLDYYDLPEANDKASWLALMQHYGVPTRLLDFSYSPYIALYFALRDRTGREETFGAELWAIDAAAVIDRAKEIFQRAEVEEAEHEAETTGQPLKSRSVTLDPRFQWTDRDAYDGHHAHWNRRSRVAVAPRDICRSYFNKTGFVDLALPPVQSRRLSSQQGVFLLNGAEKRAFSDSLLTMMNGYKSEWCKLFHMPAAILLDLERRLFQMNIHELALFPDAEGLAGFVRQKSRLHFAPRVDAARS